MNIMKYFAILAVVVLCLLGQHGSQAHSWFGHLEHEIDSEAHKIDNKVENHVHNIGHEVDHDAHKVYKDGKEALKIYGDIKTAETIVGVAGGIAHVVEHF
ncbi:hypothetical protein DOY81_002169 [Sarcophaga bullata]|nr:hypothetical protein DOY81_002169 [Sarcophaga bullata]